MQSPDARNLLLARCLVAASKDVVPRDKEKQRALWEHARAESVHLLLALRLRALGVEWSDPELARTVRGAAAAAAAREQFFARELARTLAAFADAGLPVLLLKGAAYAYELYARPELRPRSDLDLFVAPADRAAAERVLRDLGYVWSVEHVMDLASAQSHYLFRDPAGVRHYVDLHWRITNLLALAHVLPFDEVWRRSVPVEGLEHGRTLDAADSLLHACVHRIAHHGDGSAMLWVLDIYLMASRLRSEDWTVVIARSDETGVGPMVRAAIERSEAWFGGTAPAAIRPWLEEPRNATLAPGFAGRRIAPLDALRSDWRAAGTVRRRLQLLYGHLCPSPEYIRSRYGVRRPALLPLFYAGRVLAGLPRWLARSS